MNFELDDDQQQLQDSLRRLLDDHFPFEQRRRAVAADGWTPALWRALAELGVTALTLPEDQGGFGLRPIAWLPVLQELGRSLAVEPMLATGVLAATALQQAGTPAQQAAWLPGIADGSTVIAWAHEEAARRHAPLWIEARAEPDDDGKHWRVTGEKALVLHGTSADSLVVTARLQGGATDERGVGLFLVDAKAAELHRHDARLVDDTPQARVRLDRAPATRLGVAGVDAIRRVEEAGIAAVCAEALGVAERAYALTVDYVQTRQQFGRAIGANQAVRHRVAEMTIALDMVRAAATAGLLALEIEDAGERSRELSRAKMGVSKHGIFIAQQGIQLHGGIGMTVEYPVGHCLRRMTVIEQLFGDGPTHAARLGAALAA